jgi:hypothetical protein
MIQPQINSLVVAGQHKYALKLLNENPQSYGPQNELLYQMDLGMLLHLSGRYEESIIEFEKAKSIFDELYTKSISKGLSTWLMNDNSAPYRGEDFERVMINVFQAMNFAALGKYDEALVEARDVNNRLKVINDQYPDDQKNAYQDDVFARLLMGILYETAGTSTDINDAYISYAKAVEHYQGEYLKHFGATIPLLLKQNILAVAQEMGIEEYVTYQNKFPDVRFVSFKDKQKKAQVYLIVYNGFSPIKYQADAPIPLPGGFITKLSFPQFEERMYSREIHRFQAESKKGKYFFESDLDVGENLSMIAEQNLANRKARVIAKAAFRAAGKYIFEKEQESRIDNSSETGADWFRYISNLYNIVSEQADLRSWQTLPAEFQIGALILDPGEYEFMLDEQKIKRMNVQAGGTYFLIQRTR